MDITKIGDATVPKIPVKSIKMVNLQMQKQTRQTKQDNNLDGVSINISKEGLDQLKARKTLSPNNAPIGDINDLIRGKDGMIENFIEFTDPSLVLVLPEKSPAEIYNEELIGAVSSRDSTADKLNSLSSKYMDLRKEIKEKYSGDELVEQLKLLDESYDDRISGIAKGIEIHVRMEFKLQQFWAKAHQTFDTQRKDTIELEYDEEALAESTNTLIQNIQNSIKHLGDLAKQYMINGHDPADKDAFAAYISQDVEESGYFSSDDIDTIKTIFNTKVGDEKRNTRYAGLEKLENSGISDALKASILRLTIQGERLSDTVSDAHKESNNKLFALMLKWEKSSN